MILFILSILSCVVLALYLYSALKTFVVSPDVGVEKIKSFMLLCISLFSSLALIGYLYY